VKMSLVVQKYGGSSLASPRHIRHAADRIAGLKRSAQGVVVVVSAMGRTTDHLISLARKTVSNPSERELDMLLTVGERISMALLAMALHEQGIAAISFTGSQSGIVTSPDHTDARIIDIRAHRILAELAQGKVVIVAGFQGVSEQKEITTLGRGGSDTTAVAIAAALKASRCEILTDVDGLFTADPRLVPNAQLLPTCSYDEALELANLGAKMHSRSIGLAKRYSVDVRILSSMNDRCKGTRLIVGGSPQEKSMEKLIIRGIATSDGYHHFRVRMKLKEVLPVLKECRVPIHFIHSSLNDVSFLISKERAAETKKKLEHFDSIEETPKVATVSAVGEGLCSAPEVLPLFMEAIQEAGVECLLLCSNSVSITAALPSDQCKKLAIRLHEKLIEGNSAPKQANTSELELGTCNA
ncbi:MAG: aspartate kinase, partial [Deltaproteobacteria bacterium]|nr:aspartate kinase [Deltaproteobacteria bacterium]